MSEDDAVAAYLARERAALGEDADLFSGSGNANGDAPKASVEDNGFPDLDDFASASPAAAQQQPPTQNFSAMDVSSDPMSNFPSFDAPSGGQSEYKVTGHEGTGVEEDEERARFESSFPDIGGEASAIEVGPSAMIGFERFVELNTTSICRPTPPDHTQSIPYGATPYPAQPYSAPTQASNYTSILPAPTFPSTQLAEQDSPAIAEWRERQAGEIKKRDEESKRKKEEVVLKAEKAIDGFYERYNEEKEKSIKKNKEDEKAFLENLQESLSKGTTWERITDLVDLQNSQSKTLRASVPGGSDLARMKEILLSLRREGDKAPAAGGY